MDDEVIEQIATFGQRISSYNELRRCTLWMVAYGKGREVLSAHGNALLACLHVLYATFDATVFDSDSSSSEEDLDRPPTASPPQRRHGATPIEPARFYNRQRVTQEPDGHEDPASTLASAQVLPSEEGQNQHDLSTIAGGEPASGIHVNAAPMPATVQPARRSARLSTRAAS